MRIEKQLCKNTQECILYVQVERFLSWQKASHLFMMFYSIIQFTLPPSRNSLFEPGTAQVLTAEASLERSQLATIWLHTYVHILYSPSKWQEVGEAKPRESAAESSCKAIPPPPPPEPELWVPRMLTMILVRCRVILCDCEDRKKNLFVEGKTFSFARGKTHRHHFVRLFDNTL